MQCKECFLYYIPDFRYGAKKPWIFQQKAAIIKNGGFGFHFYYNSTDAPSLTNSGMTSIGA